MAIKVLLVEDDATSLRLLRKIVVNIRTDLGIFFTDNGVDAFEMFKANESEIALIISDFHMPGMTGLDLLKAIRKRGSSVDFVMISAQADTESVKQAIAYQVKSYLLKPFDPERIKELLSNY